MKLLLDEMLSPDIAELLRGRGYDVARAPQQALVTHDVRDFRPLHVAAVQAGGAGHYGLIFMAGNFRRSKADIGRIAEGLEAKLRQHPGLGELANAEDWL